MNKAEKADIAFDLYQEILDTIPEETLRVFKLGHLFKRIRDEKLYKCLDSECDNFEQFCADPTVGYQRATIYSYIKIWEKYIEELHLNMDVLRHIKYKRLQLILPHVSKDPDEWLSRAKEWSYKDLINETRKLKGRPAMKEAVGMTPPLSADYLGYVKNHGCIFHPKRKAEKAHFPRTDKRGAPKEHVIPLCADCHHHLHDLGVVSFFGQYRNQICGYYYATIEKLYKEINCLTQ